MPTLIERYELHQMRTGLAPGTIKLRHDQYMRFEKATGIALDTHIKAEQIQEWLDTLVMASGKRKGQPISDKTRSCYITSFSSMYKWATNQDIIGKNPIDKIERPKVHAGMPNPIPEDQLAMAIRKASPLLRCWIAFEAYGGLRCMEVATLEATDILWDERQVRVRKGKGGKARRVPLHGEMSRALRAYDKLERHHRATAFRDDGDGRLWPRCSAASVSQRINRFYHGMGIVHTAHKNRHRAGTQAHKASGGDLLVVQRFLGHSNPATSAVYAGLDDEEVQTAIMAIPVAGRKANEAPDLYDDDEQIAQ